MMDYTNQQFGNYRLVRLLGQGGFASVYLGQHMRIPAQQVAIKILRLFDVNTEQFQREAETTASLEHPHIVRLFDFDLREGTPFLVMAYAPNGSLRARHARGTQVPLATVVRYVNEIASALQYAHDQKVVHRDIKPENMLIGRHNELLLSDFGISVLSKTGRTTLAASYDAGGTALYMAPEQFRGKPEKASDQYSLAITVYEWLCGDPPFSEGDFIQLGFQHTHEPVPSLREKVPALSLAVESVLMRALAKKPGERFASVKEFAEALEEASKRPSAGTKPLTYTGHAAEIYAVRWSPDGTRLASCSVDNTVQVWEANSGRLLLTYRGHADVVSSVAWSPNGLWLASGSWDTTLQIWEASSGRTLSTYKWVGGISSVAWSPDGMRLASSSNDNTIQIWEASVGRPHIYHGHTGIVRSVAWSPDGLRLASSSNDRTMRVWDINSGKILHLCKGFADVVLSVAWSPNGMLIASSSADRMVHVWEANSGKLLHTYAGHAAGVSSVAWSPDGTRLVTGADDKTVRVWEVHSGRMLRTYTGHTDEVWSVAWSPDGTRLASGSKDGVVQVWQAV